MTTRTYTYHEESGYSEPLDAADMDEACDMAEELARGGDWGDDGASVEVWVNETDQDGEETDRRSLTVEIKPDHDALISAAGGDASCDHDWTAEGEGGCDQNPGVWSAGGSAMVFRRHCRACGLQRVEHWTGCQRNPGEHDTFSYTQPASWCAECEHEECVCEEVSQ